MELNLQNFSSLVENMCAAVQGNSSDLLNFSEGSVLRALAEANASTALWLQWLIVQVLQMTRASTSQGSDLDSWMADFSLTRLPAAKASGQVVFSRFSPEISAFIPAGTGVKIADGTESFIVTPELTATQNTLGNGIKIPAGVKSLSVPVTAVTPGKDGNVLADTVTVLTSPLVGIDTITNPQAFSGGTDQESDAAFRKRFQNYLSTRSLATKDAIDLALAALQQKITYKLIENQRPDGSEALGHFTVILNTENGGIPKDLLGKAYEAINRVRPIGSSFSVVPPEICLADISLSFSLNTENVLAQTLGAQNFALENASDMTDPRTGQIQNNIMKTLQSYINALPIGAFLPFSVIPKLVYNAEPAVTNVFNITLNNKTADLHPPVNGIIKAGTVNIAPVLSFSSGETL